MAEYRIDDLARTVGTTVRNIRAYQDRGLLHPPRLLGRAGIYSDSHVHRLRHILSLLQRGYASAQIQELLDAWDAGRDLAQVIDLEGAVTDPWSNEIPFEASREELAERMGGEEQLDRMQAIGWVRQVGNLWQFRSTRLIQAFEQVAEYGWDKATLVGVYEEIDEGLGTIADSIVGTAASHLLGTYGDTWMPHGAEVKEVTDMVSSLRQTTLLTIRIMLAKSMEERMDRAVSEHLARIAATKQAATKQPETSLVE